jgi:signal peptidase I
MISEADLQSACCDLLADVVRRTGSGNLRAMGCSMLPAIQPGDVLDVHRRPFDELQVGEIVVFLREGKLTAHRIIRILGEHLVTRGDSLPTADLPVRFSEVIGRVEGIARDGHPVSLEFSVWRRLIAAILRRSEWSLQLYLRLGFRLRKMKIAVATAGY